MSTIVLAPFDPITEEEVRFVLSLVKKRHLKAAGLLPWGEGVLDRKSRSELVQAAVLPYRRLYTAESIERDDEVIAIEDTSSEEKARSGCFYLCCRAVRNMLNENGYYYEEIARQHCNPHRFTHSLGVAATARGLAEAHHLDGDRAYRAGLLHDVTKALSDEEGRAIIARYKPEWLDISPKVWHSYTAVVFCKQNLDLQDQEILHAIEHHTIGDGKTDLDRILYIADKIEPGRGYDTSKEMALSLKDLRAGADLIREESRKYIFEKEGVHV